jgi:uncharacterized RDD family membrane protein YckC
VPAPDQLSIDTPEHIALDFPLAGVGSRFLALAYDTLLQAVLLGGLGIVAAIIGLLVVPATGRPAVGLWTFAILIVLGFAVYTGYFALFETIWNGQTPGKRQVGLRVIDVSGRPITAYAAILRNLLRLVDQLPGFYALAIASVLLTERNQRLGDLAAGTVVVHDRLEARLALPAAEVRARTGAQRLTAAELTLLEGFLRRRADLDPPVRLQTARHIAARMTARLGIEGAGPPEDEERFLEQLAAEARASGSYR